MTTTRKENETDANGVKPKYDPGFTDKVIAATGPKANPRLKQIMPSLLRHLHDFAREVDLTVAEWTVGVDLVSFDILTNLTHLRLIRVRHGWPRTNKMP